MAYKSYFLLSVGLLLIAGSESRVTEDCLACIRYVETKCRNPNPCCKMDRGSLSCGPLQIKQLYWSDVRTGRDWQTCSCDLNCSKQAVAAYMNLYGRNARTCRDYARIHNGGPQGLKKASTLHYANQVDNCLRRRLGCN